jgi:hypothetical protein
VPAIAARYPTIVDGMVIVSGMTDPSHQTIRKASYWMDHAAIRWMIPPFLRHTNDEKLASESELL